MSGAADPRVSLGLHALTLAAWLGALGFEAGAPRTAIWPPPWIAVYVLAAADGFVLARGRHAGRHRQLGLAATALAAAGAALRTTVPAVHAAGALYAVDLPLVLGLGVTSIGVTAAVAGAPDASRSARVVSIALLLVFGLTLLTEYVARPNLWHGSEFYFVTAAAVPAMLTFAAMTAAPWGATAAAAGYMALAIAVMWLLEALSSAADAAIVPPAFPLLLIVPALGIDVLLRTVRSGPRWWRRGGLFGAIGGVFVLAMLAAHWPFADFLLGQVARSWVFAVDQWPYHAEPGAWQHQYWTLDPGTRAFAVTMGLAVVAGTLSAALGGALADRTIPNREQVEP